jgi:hypothetical protein
MRKANPDEVQCGVSLLMRWFDCMYCVCQYDSSWFDCSTAEVSTMGVGLIADQLAVLQRSIGEELV